MLVRHSAITGAPRRHLLPFGPTSCDRSEEQRLSAAGCGGGAYDAPWRGGEVVDGCAVVEQNGFRLRGLRPLRRNRRKQGGGGRRGVQSSKRAEPVDMRISAGSEPENVTRPCHVRLDSSRQARDPHACVACEGARRLDLESLANSSVTWRGSWMES